LNAFLHWRLLFGKKIKYIPSSGSYTLIKAWLGTYRLQGDPELISLAYDAGLGAKPYFEKESCRCLKSPDLLGLQKMAPLIQQNCPLTPL